MSVLRRLHYNIMYLGCFKDRLWRNVQQVHEPKRHKVCHKLCQKTTTPKNQIYNIETARLTVKGEHVAEQNGIKQVAFETQLARDGGGQLRLPVHVARVLVGHAVDMRHATGSVRDDVQFRG
jgi:hypothetical protein